MNRQEIAISVSRVQNWPEHCLLVFFINGLKEELKDDIRIHKPNTVYKLLSLAVELEAKLPSRIRPNNYYNNFRKPLSSLTQQIRPNPSTQIWSTRPSPSSRT